MSVVVAKYDERFERVVLGADAQVTMGQNMGSLKAGQGKIWSYQVGEFPKVVMGAVGTWRDAQVIQNIDIIEANDFVSNPEGFTIKWMVTEFVPRMFGILEALGRIGTVEDEGFHTKYFANQWLFACGDTCFRIDQDGCVTEMDDNFCIGSGADVAKGAMQRYKGNNAFEAIVDAIQATADTTIYVNDTMDFLTTEDIGEEMEYIQEDDYEGLEKYWKQYELAQKELEEKGSLQALLADEYAELKAKFDVFTEVTEEIAGEEIASKIAAEYKNRIHKLGLQTVAEKINGEVIPEKEQPVEEEENDDMNDCEGERKEK